MRLRVMLHELLKLAMLDGVGFDACQAGYFIVCLVKRDDSSV